MGIVAAFDRERLGRILDGQHNVVTWRQLTGCGMTRGAIHGRVSPGGRWRIILPGVYVAGDGPVTVRQREMAAQLYAGPRAAITGPFAIRHYGLVASGPDYIEVLIPVHVRRQSVRFARLIHTARMPERAFLSGPIRLTAPARAVADAARGYREINDVRTVICAAIQRGLCSLAELAAEHAEGPKRGSAMLLRGIADAAAGIWSAAEGELMDLVHGSDLPEPEYNVALYAADGEFLGIVDAWWQRAGVAAEVDSQEFHFQPADWRATMDRHNRITRRRVQLMHFAPARIKSDGAAVLADLREAIAAGLAAPALPLTAIRQRVGSAIDPL